MTENILDKIGHFKTDSVSNVGMIPCFSNSEDHFLDIIYHQSIINVLKGYKKMKNINLNKIVIHINTAFK